MVKQEETLSPEQSKEQSSTSEVLTSVVPNNAYGLESSFSESESIDNKGQKVSPKTDTKGNSTHLAGWWNRFIVGYAITDLVSQLIIKMTFYKPYFQFDPLLVLRLIFFELLLSNLAVFVPCYFIYKLLIAPYQLSNYSGEELRCKKEIETYEKIEPNLKRFILKSVLIGIIVVFIAPLTTMTLSLIEPLLASIVYGKNIDLISKSLR